MVTRLYASGIKRGVSSSRTCAWYRNDSGEKMMTRALALNAIAAAAAACVFAAPAQGATCPAFGADTDCGYLITINPDGSITAGPTAQGPYDGSEDTLVGVINNSPTPLTTLTLSGSNIFGFDGDGESSYTGTSYGPTGYEGPNTSFTIVDPNNGSVDFTNGGVMGNGGTAWFTLEENLASITGGVNVITGGVPEPSTWAMMLLGFGAVGFAMRKRALPKTKAIGSLA